MAAVSDSGGNSESTLTRIPTPDAGGADVVKRWVDYAVGQTVVLKQSLGTAADSAVRAAGSGLSQIRSASSAGLQEAKGMMDLARNQYAAYEGEAFGKIKEGIVVAAAHPDITCGIAAGIGLLAFNRPRRFLIGNIRRIFMSEESLLSDAETKVNGLRQSINLVKNESKKLEERASKAEEEMERGRMLLIKEGREIQGKLRFVSKIENEATGVRDLISELPRREAAQYQSEVSALVSAAKKEKKALSRAASKIINHGIPL